MLLTAAWCSETLAAMAQSGVANLHLDADGFAHAGKLDTSAWRWLRCHRQFAVANSDELLARQAYKPNVCRLGKHQLIASAVDGETWLDSDAGVPVR